MRIACPSCDATYEVPDARLSPGKMVRCARCDNTWLPEHRAADLDAAAWTMPAPADAGPMAADATAEDGETESANADPEATPAGPQVPLVTAMDRLTASAVPAHRLRRGLIGAWALSFVVLAGAVAATVEWRDAVVRAWPPSGRILPSTGAIPAPAQTAGRRSQ